MRVAEFENGLAYAIVTYDDTVTPNIITSIRCVNNSSNPVYMRYTKASNGREIGNTFQPGTDTTFDIPPGQQNALEFTDIGRSHWSGIALSTRY